MAVSITTQTDPYVDKLIVDIDANATVEPAAMASSSTSYIWDIDNTSNSATVCAKFFNHANPTLDGSNSSTEPSVLIVVPKQTRQTVTVSDGVVFATALSFACTAGAATTSNTSPANAVTIRIMAE